MGSNRIVAPHGWALGLVLVGVWTASALAADGPNPGEKGLGVAGYIVPAAVARVSPAVAGQVIEVPVKEGDVVKAGDVLARLDETPFKLECERMEARLQQAEARLIEVKAGARKQELDEARAALAEGEAVLQHCEADYKRAKALAAQGAITAKEVAEMEKQYKLAEARLLRLHRALELLKVGARAERIAVAEAEVKEAEAQVKKARYNLAQTSIRSPISGTVLNVGLDQGSYVNPRAPLRPDSAFTVADLRHLEVEVPVLEKDLTRVVQGQRCLVRADAYPKETYRGQVVRILPVADRARACVTVRVRLDLPDKDDRLRPEMRAVVEFLPRD